MVTIVVLLILAGITIALVFGQNGVISKAQEAQNKWKDAVNTEQQSLEKVSQDIEGIVGKISDNTPGDITDGGIQDGTEEKPYKIRSIEDFLELLTISRREGVYDKYIELETNLDFKNPNSYNDATDTERFGDYNEDGETKGIMEELTDENGTGLKNGFEFDGILKGKGHTISNIYIKESLLYNSTDAIDYLLGIFQENTGTINDFNVQGKMLVSIEDQTTAARIGGIVAQNKHDGKLINCTSDMEITVTANNLLQESSTVIYVGGIAGENEEGTGSTTIDGCTFKGNINSNLTINENTAGSKYHDIKIGGIAGKNEEIITNSINESNIDTTKNYYTTVGGVDSIMYTAGIAGENNDKGIIENCINLGNINSTSETSELYVGGIVGASEDVNTCIIKNVYNSGKISAKTTNDVSIGGVLAEGNGVIDAAYNIGTISTESNAEIKMGAIIGKYNSNASITNCFYNKTEGLYGAEGQDVANIVATENLSQTQVVQELNTKVEENNLSSSRRWYKLVETGETITFEK